MQEKFDAFPADARQRLMEIRDLIYALAERENLGDVHETLKWGEPSYLVKRGSTVRIAWKTKHPSAVSVFVNCNTILVETFRELFPDSLEFVGNREIRLPISRPIPSKDLEACILLALRYHDLKHLPMLGV